MLIAESPQLISVDQKMSSDALSMGELLSHALRVDAVVNLIPDTPDDQVVDEATMLGWDSGHDIESEFIRELLLGRIVADADPRGLVIRGARVQGPLDLDRVDTSIALTLLDCLLPDGVLARRSPSGGWLVAKSRRLVLCWTACPRSTGQ